MSDVKHFHLDLFGESGSTLNFEWTRLQKLNHFYLDPLGPPEGFAQCCCLSPFEFRFTNVLFLLMFTR